MKITTPPLIVEKTDGFDKDALGRKYFADNLLNLVSHTNEPLVISLDGQWGEGKTTFVKMWQGLLSQAEIPNLYFDAFKHDHIDDAFIAIVSAMTSYAKGNSAPDSEDEVSKELSSRAINVVRIILGVLAKGLIKQALPGIKDNDIDAITKTLQGNANSIERAIANKIDSYQANIDEIESFSKLLSEMPAKLNNNPKEKSLVIIIDELDRCKPTFAVQIIERIKHFFSVDNITFVLVMNKTQLEASIESVYGGKIDAHTYLQKFITLETIIPKNKDNLDKNEHDVAKYTHHLFKRHEMQDLSGSKGITDNVAELARHFDLSLRQLEKVFTNLALFYSSYPEGYQPISEGITSLITFLCVIKVKKPAIFRKLANQQISLADLCNDIKFNEIKDKQHDLYWTKQCLRVVMLPEAEYKDVAHKGDLATAYANLRSWIDSIGGHHENLIPDLSRFISMVSKN